MPSRLHQNTLLRRQVQASHHWCRTLTTTTKEDCCYLPPMQQENEQGFPFSSHGENSWGALRGATRTSRSIPGLTSAQGLRHQLAPRAQEMEMPCGGLPYKASTNTNFHNHFIHRHPYDSIHLTNESLEPWDKCELCGVSYPYLEVPHCVNDLY